MKMRNLSNRLVSAVGFLLLQTTLFAQYIHPNQAGRKGGDTGPGIGRQVITTTYFGYTTDNLAQGTIVSVNKDGTNATALYGFKGFPADGSYSWYTTPHQASDGNLYGATYVGGSSNWGSVYRYVPGTGTENIIFNNAPGTGSAGNYGNINELSDGKIYSVQTVGGSDYLGGIYSMNKDGSGLTLIHSFRAVAVTYTAAATAQLSSGQTPLDGVVPYGFVVEGPDGKIYGSTLGGGANGRGAFYRCNKDGSAYEIINIAVPVLKSYVNGKGGLIPVAYNLVDPFGNVAIDQQGRVYVTGFAGGAANLGGVARMNADGSNYQLLHSGNAAEGYNPYRGALIIDNQVYGTYRDGGSQTLSGGIAHGVVYGMDLDGSNYKLLKSFDASGGIYTDGYQPWSGVSYDGEFLFGTTIVDGGPGYVGTIYKVRPDGSGFQTIHRFSQTAAAPCGGKPSIFSYYPSAERVTFGDAWLKFSQTCIPSVVCNAGSAAPALASGSNLSNQCGSTTVDLTNVAVTNKPAGAQVEWYTSAVVSSLNKVPDPTAVGAGTYYALFFDAVNGCHSGDGNASTPVTVTINACPLVNYAPLLLSDAQSNVCPAATADLTTLLYDTPPSGATVTWHTGTPASDANKIANPAAVTANTYYAAYYDGSKYGPASSAVVVTIISCTGSNLAAACPQNTANLTAYTVGTAPANTVLTWHTATPATPANQVADPANAAPGTYYPVFFDAADNCYGNPGAPVTVGPCAALPVTLVRFDGREESGMVDLFWSTTAETNSDRFEVLRSSTLETWEEIGSVPSNVMSTSRKNYSFRDKMPAKGMNYYRLRMVDKDGTFTYSKVVSILLYGTNIVIYPNPVSETIKIDPSVLYLIKSIRIASVNGTVVYTDQQVSKPTIDVRNWQGGIYVIMLTGTDGSVHIQKVEVRR